MPRLSSVIAARNDLGMEKPNDRDVRLLAEQQHGVFTRRQALEAGCTSRVIDNRLSNRRWTRLTDGVYLLAGAPATPTALAKAATLSIPGSVASHEMAAELHRFSFVPKGRVVVTAGPGANHRNPLATVHEYIGIEDADHTAVFGIPVTSAELTLFHLADVLKPHRVERVLDDRLAARAVDILDLCALADFWARKGRRKAQIMRPLLARRGPGYVAPESVLEAAFLSLVQRFDLPEPQRQFATPWDSGEGRVDFAYERAMVLIEVDGRRWHTRDQDYEKDRARDRKAQLLGWSVLRYTHHEVTRRTESTAREIRECLERTEPVRSRQEPT